MKNILRTVCLACLVAIGCTASAQLTHTAGGTVDQNAEKLLAKASRAISASPVSFSVEMISKDSDKRETARMKASVLYSKGRYRATFGNNVIYCDGKSTWHWNKEAKEVVVNNMVESEDDLMNPASILSNYKKNFRAKLIRQDDGGTSVIDLTPNKPKSYYKIRLLMSTSSGQLQRLEMHNYDGSCGEYLLSNYKNNVKVSDNDFAFPKAGNPDVEIIDMR